MLHSLLKSTSVTLIGFLGNNRQRDKFVSKIDAFSIKNSCPLPIYKLGYVSILEKFAY